MNGNPKPKLFFRPGEDFLMNTRTFSPTATRVLTLFLILTGLSLAPLLFVLLPPLNDYPNHLARMHILSGLGTSEYLQRYYRNVMLAQPNLAMDLIVPVLAKFFPLQIAGKIFIGLTAVLTAAATMALHRAIHGRWSFWPLIAFFFVFHRMMLWGLLNFCFGIGMMLLGLAIWLAVRGRSAPIRIALSTISAAAIYLSHLYAFGVYAVALAGLELWQLFQNGALRKKIKEVSIAAAQFLLPLYFFLFLEGAAATVHETQWGSIWRKFEAPFDVIYQYNLPLDIGSLFFIAALIGLGLWKRRISFDLRMAAPLALLAGVFLLMPDELLTGYGADRRLPIAIALIFVAATDWQPSRPLWREPAAIALAGLFLIRTAVLANVWHQSNEVYSQYFAAFAKIPPGAKILPYTLQPEMQSLQAIPLLEGAALGIVLKDAFVPSLFTSPPLAAESVAFAPKVENLGLKTHFHIQRGHDVAAIWREKTPKMPRVFRKDILSQFDYVFITRPDALRPGMLPAGLTPIYRGTTFTLWKVGRPLPSAG